MTFDELRRYLLDRPEAWEDRPFGPQALVFKVLDRMFALVPLESKKLSVTLKCDPDLAPHWRAMYDSVRPAWHFNKRHWNTVLLDGGVPQEHVLEMIDDSYKLVVGKLRKADRERLKAMLGPGP